MSFLQLASHIFNIYIYIYKCMYICMCDSSGLPTLYIQRFPFSGVKFVLNRQFNEICLSYEVIILRTRCSANFFLWMYYLISLLQNSYVPSVYKWGTFVHVHIRVKMQRYWEYVGALVRKGITRNESKGRQEREKEKKEK